MSELIEGILVLWFLQLELNVWLQVSQSLILKVVTSGIAKTLGNLQTQCDLALKAEAMHKWKKGNSARPIDRI